MPRALQGAMVRRTSPRSWEVLPPVDPTAIIGLLVQLAQSGSRQDLWTLGRALESIRAAHQLGFVVTEAREIALTGLGTRFVKGTADNRRTLFAQRLLQLNLFRDIICRLHCAERHELDEATLLHELHARVPFVDPEQLLGTFLSWARFAGLLTPSDDSRKIRLA